MQDALKAAAKAKYITVVHPLQPEVPQALSTASILKVKEILSYLMKFPGHNDNKVLSCIYTITKL